MLNKRAKKNKPSSILDKMTLFDQGTAQKIGQEVFIRMQENPGMTLKEATGVSDVALEEIYSLAYTYYNQGKYGESKALFEFLAGASPATYKYVLGLASNYHQLKQYDEAAVGFFIALRLDPSNPIPAYYVTDCFLKQQLNQEALEFAQITAAICENQPEHSGLKNRCELMIQKLKK